MDGENEVMDFDARTDAAMEAFSGDTPTPDANAQQATQDGDKPPVGAEGQQLVDDPNAPVQTPDEAVAGLTDEQRLADPQFQQLSEFKDAVEGVFAEFNIPDANEAKLQLTDAQVLYQIANGQAPPSQLLDLFAQNWQPEQVKAVAGNLIQWLTAKGFLKDGQAGTPPKQGDPGFKDPLEDRLGKLEKGIESRKGEEAAKAETGRRETIFKDKFLPAVTNLCNQKSIPAEDHLQYSNAIASLINGNPAILKRIEAGNTVDVQKFFAQVHNAEVARLTRYNAAQLKTQQAKEKNNPRIPSGGAPPAPAGSAKKVNVRNRDDRIAAAAELL